MGIDREKMWQLATTARFELCRVNDLMGALLEEVDKNDGTMADAALAMTVRSLNDKVQETFRALTAVEAIGRYENEFATAKEN